MTPRLRERDDQAAALRRLMQAAPPAPADTQPPRASRSVAIASGKGGVGKTTIAVNLALALAAERRRTTLLDGDLGLANADVLLGMVVRSHLGHVAEGSRRMDEIVVEAPGGVRLIPGGAGLSRLADLEPHALHDLLHQLEAVERDSDVLVIDCGAGVHQSVLTLLESADLALIVATPEPTSITDAYALVKCLVLDGRRGPDRGLGLVVNRATDEREALQVHARLSAVCTRFLGVPLPLTGWIAEDDAAGRAVRARTPLLTAAPRAAASQSLRVLARRVRDDLGLRTEESARRGGLVRRLIGFLSAQPARTDSCEPRAAQERAPA